MVAFGGENASGEVICRSSDVRFVSPSVLSKFCYNLVMESKLTKAGEIKTLFCLLLIFNAGLKRQVIFCHVSGYAAIVNIYIRKAAGFRRGCI